MGKQARTNKRKRRLLAVRTPAGAAEVQAAGRAYRGALQAAGRNLDEPPPAELSDFLAGTELLPGHAGAVASAEAAWATLVGRLPAVREWHRAVTVARPAPLAEANAVLLSSASYGDGAHGPYLQHAFDTWGATGQYRSLVAELARRQGNAAKKDRPNSLQFANGSRVALPLPLADLPEVATALTLLWVGGGLWLCDYVSVVAILRDGVKLSPFRGPGPVVVTESNLVRIVSELDLHRYRGRGRLLCDANGPRWDDTLKVEVQAARAAAGAA